MGIESKIHRLNLNIERQVEGAREVSLSQVLLLGWRFVVVCYTLLVDFAAVFRLQYEWHFGPFPRENISPVDSSCTADVCHW
jgi:hypothetical protein